MSPNRPGVTSLAGLLSGIEQYESFVRDLAAVILPQQPGFESVWDVTNRVYDRCCANRMSLVPRNRHHAVENMALSA